MTKINLKRKSFPETPGVYFFLGRQKEILYIGKATSLRSRVASYFAPDLIDKRSPLIGSMVELAKTIDFTATDSVLEAMILETNLIRTHRPKYNTMAKDDKSYNHLIITNEEWPRVLVVRGKDITEKFTPSEIKYHFGPFPNGQLFREALKIVRRLFRFYDTKKPLGTETSKVVKGQIDFNRQIGLFPNQDSKEEYLRTIKHLRLFFEGKKHLIIKELEKEMMKLAKAHRFEEASVIKMRIFALKHIEDVSLIKNDFRFYRSEKNMRLEAYDVAHLQGKSMVGVMTVFDNGELKKSDYRKFKLQTVTDTNDTAALREILTRRLNHDEWPLPQIIVVDGSTAQKNVAEAVLKKHQLSIPVVGVVKDEKHNPKRLIGSPSLLKKHEAEILLVNAEAHRFAIAFHRNKQQKNFL